jgi:hypothetical protein
VGNRENQIVDSNSGAPPNSIHRTRILPVITWRHGAERSNIPEATMRKRVAIALATPYNPGAARVREEREFRAKSAEGDDVIPVGQCRAAVRDRESDADFEAATHCDCWR